MRALLGSIIIATPLIFLTGCFDFLNPANKPKIAINTVSSITADKFTGVTSATNKISGILLSWPAVTDASLVKAYRVYRISGSSSTLIASLAPSLTSFMDGTITPGAIYNYMVKAVDRDNLEDSNTKTVRSLSWSGVDSVVADSRSSLLVTFKSPTPVVDEIRVYGQLAVGGPKTLLATATGSDETVELSSLRTGYSYIISAQAYVASLGKEDGNDLTFTASTYTQGYDTDGASASQWANVMAVRAFGAAPAAPVHPITQDKSPNTRVVELAFNAFTGVSPSAKYVVTRVIDGFGMDSSSSVGCTDTTFTSCRVCDKVSAVNGVVNCKDTAVAASPARYRYALSLIQNDTLTTDTWVEPLPASLEVLAQFSVLVPIPPKNMVLVQRDAANYEMCQQLNKSPDPNNFNRCNYTGIGGTPYSTGHNKPPLNLSSGYYDFGYNLFVDRWEMACNWTRASQGGMCGANHTSGDCYSYGPNGNFPSSSIGKLGDVFQFPTTGGAIQCFIAAAQDSITGAITWARPNSVVASYSNAKSLFQTMFTGDPGYKDSSGNYNLAIPGKKGKSNYYINTVAAANICSSKEDPNYGAKRLSRAREYIVYSAPALLIGEPYSYNSYANFNNKVLVSSTFHNASYTYGCEYGANKDVPPTNLTQLLDYTNYPAFKEMNVVIGTDPLGTTTGTFGSQSGIQFMTGAVATVDCQSRYGVQDMMRKKFVSDAMSYNSTTFKVTGLQSPYDNGNRDFLSDPSGSTSGFVMDISAYPQVGGSYGQLSSTSTVLTAFIPALGLPIVSSTYSSEYLPRALIVQPYSLSFTAPGLTSPTQLKSVQMQNRWAPTMFFNHTYLEPSTGEVRCVLPAE